MISPTPLEQLLEVAAEKRTITLGVPASVSDVDQRFPLTPEGAAMLVSRGIDVRIESKAGRERWDHCPGILDCEPWEPAPAQEAAP